MADKINWKKVFKLTIQDFFISLLIFAAYLLIMVAIVIFDQNDVYFGNANRAHLIFSFIYGIVLFGTVITISIFNFKKSSRTHATAIYATTIGLLLGGVLGLILAVNISSAFDTYLWSSGLWGIPFYFLLPVYAVPSALSIGFFTPLTGEIYRVRFEAKPSK